MLSSHRPSRRRKEIDTCREREAGDYYSNSRISHSTNFSFSNWKETRTMALSQFSNLSKQFPPLYFFFLSSFSKWLNRCGSVRWSSGAGRLPPQSALPTADAPRRPVRPPTKCRVVPLHHSEPVMIIIIIIILPYSVVIFPFFLFPNSFSEILTTTTTTMLRCVICSECGAPPFLVGEQRNNSGRWWSLFCSVSFLNPTTRNWPFCRHVYRKCLDLYRAVV